ncbi:MAG TPA: hypothetical protein VF498_12190 [Anaerolineales bacterium]
MAKEFGVPTPPPPYQEPPRKGNRTLLTIVIVILLVLCCCVAFVAFMWFYGGDALIRYLNSQALILPSILPI